MCTLNTIVEGILKIWGAEEDVPNSRRIIQDCDKALDTYGSVYCAGGKMVPQLANRSGHHNHAAGRNRMGWGGVRVENVLVEEIGRWLNPNI